MPKTLPLKCTRLALCCLAITGITLTMASFSFANPSFESNEEAEPTRAELETLKIQELVNAYNLAMRTDLVPAQLDIWNVGTILENGRTVTIYSCTPHLLQGVAGPTGSLFHITSASLLISHDAERANRAQVYRTTIKDAAYVAFGEEQTVKNSRGYREVLKNAWVMPLSGQENALLVAKIIHLNNTNPNMPITLDYQGEISKGTSGQNLPWRNWRILRATPTVDTSLMDLEAGIKKVSSMKGSIALGVRIQKAPIALLDSYGRVIVGKFNFGQIEDSAINQVKVWQGRVETQAQALWASKLLSSQQIQLPESIRQGLRASKVHSSKNSNEQNNVLRFAWFESGWPEKMARPQEQLPFFLIQSTTSGRTSGEYRNPNYKFVLRFTDIEEQLQFQLNIQNNIRNIVGRALPFGNRTSAELFTNSDGSYTDVVNLQMGFDSVQVSDGGHNIEYGFKRQIPHGVLMIHELELTSTGEVGRMRATLDFSFDRWADVHPAGHAVAEINFSIPDFHKAASIKLTDANNLILCESALF